MSEYLGSAFASFVDQRNSTTRSPPPDRTSAETLPFAPLSIPASAARAPKRMRYAHLPTVLVPESLARAPLVSPVSVLAAPAASPFPPFNPLSPLSSVSDDTCDPSLSNPLGSSCCADSSKRRWEPAMSPPQEEPVSTLSHRRCSATRALPGRQTEPCERLTFGSGESAAGRTKPHKCSHCSSNFEAHEELMLHVKTAHQRPFGCRVTGCSASFSKQNHLSRHIRIVHNKERPFACEEPGCGSRFGSKSHLGDHTRAVHMRLRNFKCLICGASWSKRFNLEKHIRIRHLGEKPFKCGTCSLSFGTRSHVTRHEMKVHKRSSELIT